MNITTKYETGDVVYAVHPCQVINNGQVILNEGTLRMEPDEAGQDFHADDIYIVSPHEVRNITVFCSKGSKTEIIYELSNGTKRTEQELFASFESAAEYAVTLYEKASGKYGKQIIDPSIKTPMDALTPEMQIEYMEVDKQVTYSKIILRR